VDSILSGNPKEYKNNNCEVINKLSYLINGEQVIPPRIILNIAQCSIILIMYNYGKRLNEMIEKIQCVKIKNRDIRLL
ncbi:hypothetical protein, partial [Enterobacter ludwigii]|uniref:hypothetical protein n=1 Tax=Enterobacter ludwigii TaxID=299767 RepID=UPI0034176DB0